MRSGGRQARAAGLVVLLSFLTLSGGYGAASLVNLDEPPHLDINSHRFADSSLVDFSRRLGPPAGQRGFLTVSEEGQFCFGEGQRVRFCASKEIKADLPKGLGAQGILLFCQ